MKVVLKSLITVVLLSLIVSHFSPRSGLPSSVLVDFGSLLIPRGALADGTPMSASTMEEVSPFNNHPAAQQ